MEKPDLKYVSIQERNEWTLVDWIKAIRYWERARRLIILMR